MSGKNRFEVKVVAGGWHYEPMKSLGKENEQGSLYTSFTNEFNVRQIVWPMVGPNYAKLETGEMVVCCYEPTSNGFFRLIGVASILRLGELGLLIDPNRKIGDIAQPSPDVKIWDARELSDRKTMPMFF